MNLYDTLTRTVKEVPWPNRALTMYVCGVTVYDHCHIGHARCYVVWDVLRRWLEYCGQDVFYVQNFTDVDDKIILKAKKEGVTTMVLAQRYIESYFEDMDCLNIKRARLYPRVTVMMEDMREAVQRLIKGGFAYEFDGDIKFWGDVYESYGLLSRVDDVADDFTLWKGRKPGEHEFPNGRPGWHLECSVMIEKTIGETVDIHAGGVDLTFPHHENEMAQSSCLHGGKPLALHWAHNGLVMTQGAKMSKGTGNTWKIKDCRRNGIDANQIRYWVLQAGYRKPLAHEALGSAKHQWAGTREKLRHAPENGVSQEFVDAMNDDLNTPMALAVLYKSPTREMANILGFQLNTDPIPKDVLDLVKRRAELRQWNQHEKSDELRAEIIARGYQVRDLTDGTSELVKS